MRAAFATSASTSRTLDAMPWRVQKSTMARLAASSSVSPAASSASFSAKRWKRKSGIGGGGPSANGATSSVAKWDRW